MGRRVPLGRAILDVVQPVVVCVMVTGAQPGRTGHDLDVLWAIVGERGGDPSPEVAA